MNNTVICRFNCLAAIQVLKLLKMLMQKEARRFFIPRMDSF